MGNSFYWYDLETSGTEPKWDRVVQFAGMRTDQDLNPIGDEYCTYVQLADDVLPSPDASLVTGISPQLAERKGISETQAWLNIEKLFMQPGTCVVGYNSLRFDDEFVRYGFYRHLLDPYAREWQQGNSRWDIIDLVRATGALRREGVNWPVDEEGLPVYKLEVLTKANGIDHGHAHDALSDVHATIALAKLIKTAQPRLFDYYFGLRHKKQVRAMLEPFGAHVRVHVSAIHPRQRFGVAPITSIARHPTNGNSVIVVDLGSDVEPLLDLTAEELAQQIFSPGAHERPPLKEIRINRCPFIAPWEVLNDENKQRLGIDERLIKERQRRLKQPGLLQKLLRVYQQPSPAASVDPDAGLYDRFLQEEDRSRCRDVHASIAQGRWRDTDFSDERLRVLAQRMKARSFPALLDAPEIAQWVEFVGAKLTGEGDWLNLDRFENRLQELAQTDLSDVQTQLLNDLAEHARDLRQRYHIGL